MKKRLLQQLIMASKYVLLGIFMQTLLAGLLLASDTDAQEVKSVREVYILPKVSNSSVGEIMQIIESETEYSFSYYQGEINLKKPLSINRKRHSVYDLLVDVSAQTGLSFRQINNVINVKIKEKDNETEGVEIIKTALTVTGRVSDANGEYLPGVNVLVKGSSLGTVTDVQGSYNINVPNEDDVLVFSSIGYTTQEVPVNGRTTIDLSLEEDVKSLEEIVVIGYGAVEKRDLTGAVSSVSEEEIKSLPVTRVDQALQGRAAGVQVTQTDASPGGNVRIRIRGGNSLQAGNDPLYVIDGFAGAGNLTSLNPSDIESIEILKDASATAIYGARGANGVVIITTKRGKAGQSSISFDASYSIQEIRNKIDMLNGTQFAEMVNEARTNDGLEPYYDNPQAFGEGTDWQDQIYRTGSFANYQLAFSGGNDKLRYAVTGNRSNQEGIIKNSSFERNSIRVNLDADLTDKLTIGNSLTASRVFDSRVGVNTARQATSDGVVIQALVFQPTKPVFDEEGNYSISEPFFDPLSNPVAKTLEPTRDDKTTRALGNVFAEYALSEHFSLKVSGGVDLLYNKNNYYEPRTTFVGAGAGGIAHVNTLTSTLWQNENTLSYKNTFGDRHAINAVVGYTQQGFAEEALNTRSEGFINDNLGFNSMQTASNTRPTETGANSWDLQSYLARINYIFNDKYLLTFTARADGSSKFGENNKWGFFPSGAFAWRLSDENFIQNTALFDDLKFRASYGITGNQEIGSFRSLAELQSGTNYILGDALAIGLFPSNVANPNLKWEQTRQLDFGLDMGFWDNRITLTTDYYFKKTTDLLYNVVLPRYTGYTSSLQNLGSLQNQGLELAVHSNNLVGALTWESDINFSFNRNEVLDLGPDEELLTQGSFIPDQATVGIIRVGRPIGLFYGYVTDGMFQLEDDIANSPQPDANPGDQKYVDVNGDGIFNADDRTVIGDPNPDFIFGFTNNLAYKSFRLNLFIQGVSGGDLLNVNKSVIEIPNGTVNNSTAVLDRWTPDNPDASITRATGSQSRRLKSDWIEDGSYLRVKNISLSYDLPQSLIQRVSLQHASLTLSGQNLITFTNYSGFDPEVNSLGSDNAVLGVDFGSYPNVKTYTLSLSIGF
ncbi:MAG: TonB-dependent receptor [Cyclobacteriaceae bacterium]